MFPPDEFDKFLLLLEKIETDKRYKLSAYGFVLSSLNHIVSELDKPRHISGRELAIGVRDLAIEEFGPMALMVLEKWGIRQTKDFGNIVFDLVDLEILATQEEDQIEDFDNIYDFTEAFNTNYFAFQDFDL
ncbi:MAG: hypothetical protein B6244_02720 [Candidatus Cloacimonetes bacterium 4572_55]|nr:MAG: hypothetical protein B6244_02720 [Candidatus Cloacimonetes bacterium 4572_55]